MTVMKTKRNYYKVPDFIWEKLGELESRKVVVACSKQVQHDDIRKGLWAHLWLKLDGHAVVAVEPEVIPNLETGRFSKRNVHGHVRVRRDLPKIWKDFSFDVPNFGDWSKGFHEVTISREVYPREFDAPREVTIQAEVLQQDQGHALVKFCINEVLDRSAPDFERRLLFNLNLLQENVRSVGVFSSIASLAEYLKTVHVDWELLPEGSRDVVLMRLLHGVRGDREEIEKTIRARRALLEQFRPARWVIGTSGLRRYFGAWFHENLVVFENITYGNALYVLSEDWTELSKLSRIELMERTSGVVRIVHRTGWEKKLCKLLRESVAEDDQREAA